jgi:hypothetical protein
MKYVLGNMLGGGFVGGLDPDAKAYIDAVVAAGGTVSGGQKSAINTFYKTGKSDGWYSLLKRMYLPTWGVAAPNAIDMIALGSGTFNGTVTHGAGFVQSDGTTGYFIDDSFANSGLTITDFYLAVLALTSSGSTSSSLVSNGASSGFTGIRRQSASQSQQIFAGTLGDAVSGDPVGVMSLAVDSTTLRLARRLSSGRTVLQSGSNPGGTLPLSDLTWMCRNNTNAAGVVNDASHTTSEWGGGALANYMSDDEDALFTFAMRQLHQSITGLTLP